MRSLIAGVFVAMDTSHPGPAYAQTPATCQVGEPVQSFLFSANGPVQGCQPGDTVYFQINTKRVAYSSLVVRYCDYSKQIIIELFPDGSAAHLSCVYQFKEWKEANILKE